MDVVALHDIVVEHRDDPEDNPEKRCGSSAIPSDIVQGSYRHMLYVYSNVESGSLTLEQKTSLIAISKKLVDEQTICWTRHHLYELDENKLIAFQQFLNELVYGVSDAAILRVCLHFLRMISKKNFFVDEYAIQRVYEIRYYIKYSQEYYAHQKEDS